MGIRCYSEPVKFLATYNLTDVSELQEDDSGFNETVKVPLILVGESSRDGRTSGRLQIKFRFDTVLGARL